MAQPGAALNWLPICAGALGRRAAAGLGQRPAESAVANDFHWLVLVSGLLLLALAGLALRFAPKAAAAAHLHW